MISIFVVFASMIHLALIIRQAERNWRKYFEKRKEHINAAQAPMAQRFFIGQSVILCITEHRLGLFNISCVSDISFRQSGQIDKCFSTADLFSEETVLLRYSLNVFSDGHILFVIMTLS
ncbi:MAG: hypothetical protein ABH844_01915 [Candidatus Omnitrophota bacterium]